MVASIIAALFSGGATGIFGALLGEGLSLLKNRQANAHELKLLSSNQKHGLAEKEIDRDIEHVSQAGKSYQASLAHDASIGSSYKAVEAIRALMRPAITSFLILLTAGIIILAVCGIVIPGVDAVVIKATVLMVLELTETVTLWWFASREFTKRRT